MLAVKEGLVFSRYGEWPYFLLVLVVMLILLDRCFRRLQSCFFSVPNRPLLVLVDTPYSRTHFLAQASRSVTSVP